jgi:hypothetical protein
MIHYVKDGQMALDEDENAFYNPYDLVVIDMDTGCPPCNQHGEAYIIEEANALEGWFRAKMPHDLPFESVRFCGRRLVIAKKTNMRAFIEEVSTLYKKYYLKRDDLARASMSLNSSQEPEA